MLQDTLAIYKIERSRVMTDLDYTKKQLELANKIFVDDPIFGNFITNDTMGMKLAKHFFELGLKVQKGE